MPLILGEISVDFIHHFLDKLLTLARSIDDRDLQKGLMKDTAARLVDLTLRADEIGEQTTLLAAEVEFHDLECDRLRAMLREQQHPAVAAALREAVDIEFPMTSARIERDLRVINAHREALLAEHSILTREFEARRDQWKEAAKLNHATMHEIREILVGVRPIISRV